MTRKRLHWTLTDEASRTYRARIDDRIGIERRPQGPTDFVYRVTCEGKDAIECLSLADAMRGVQRFQPMTARDRLRLAFELALAAVQEVEEEGGLNGYEADAVRNAAAKMRAALVAIEPTIDVGLAFELGELLREHAGNTSAPIPEVAPRTAADDARRAEVRNIRIVARKGGHYRVVLSKAMEAALTDDPVVAFMLATKYALTEANSTVKALFPNARVTVVNTPRISLAAAQAGVED